MAILSKTYHICLLCFRILSWQLNPELTPFERRFVSYVKRCAKLERKLRYFAAGCDKFELTLESAESFDGFLNSHSIWSSTSRGKQDKSGTQLLERLEVELERYESEFR